MTRKPQTLEELEAMPGETLVCADVAGVLKANPTTLHDTAIQQPGLLGFRVIVAGRRVKIPKRAFIRYMKGLPVEDTP